MIRNWGSGLSRRIKMKRIVGVTLFCGAIFLASFCVAGQDLGSSNKLFRTTKAKAPSKTPTKRTPAKHLVVARSKRPPATKPKGAAATAKTAQPAPARNAIAKPGKTRKDEIAVAPPAQTKPRKPVETREASMPVNAAAAELFEKLIEDGNSARDERNYSAGEMAYERAKAIKPKDARAAYGLGNLYSDQQRWDDAEAAYRAALELDPKNAVISIALSYVLSQPVFVANLSDRYEEAERLSRRSIELAPSNALAFDQLGVAMELRGLISSETEGAYRNAIRLDPGFAPAYAHLGRLLRRRGDMKGSQAAYESARRLAIDVGTIVLVAEVMQSEQRFAESEPLLRRAVDQDPRNPAALLLLGRALTTKGEYVDAERMLRRSLDVSPNSFRANLLLGSLYTRQSKYELAENALLQALRFVPGSEKRLLSQQFEVVGDGYLKGGKAAAAERAYRQAMSLDEQSGSLAEKLARSRHG